MKKFNIFKYKQIQERFPFNDNNYGLYSYHCKEVLINKYFLNILISSNWYSQHINSDYTCWIRVDTLDNPTYWKTLPSYIENDLNEEFLRDFENYHKDRIVKSRDYIINDLIS